MIASPQKGVVSFLLILLGGHRPFLSNSAGVGPIAMTTGFRPARVAGSGRARRVGPRPSVSGSPPSPTVLPSGYHRAKEFAPRPLIHAWRPAATLPGSSPGVTMSRL